MHACLQVGADLVGAYRKQSLDPDRLGVVTGLASGLDATLEVSQPAILCTALVHMRSMWYLLCHGQPPSSHPAWGWGHLMRSLSSIHISRAAVSLRCYR